MYCYKHGERLAVTKCSQCGKFLCQECAEYFEPHLCVDCAMSYAGEIKASMIKSIVLSVVFMIIGILLIKSPSGILLAGIPYGWGILNRITPSMFLWLSWIGWIVYFIIKLVIAYCIGLIALPIKLIRNIYQLNKINKIMKTVGEA